MLKQRHRLRRCPLIDFARILGMGADRWVAIYRYPCADMDIELGRRILIVTSKRSAPCLVAYRRTYRLWT